MVANGARTESIMSWYDDDEAKPAWIRKFQPRNRDRAEYIKVQLRVVNDYLINRRDRQGETCKGQMWRRDACCSCGPLECGQLAPSRGDGN